MLSIAISVYVRLSVCSRVSKTTCQNFTEFSLHMILSVAVARFCSVDNAIRNVVLVLWMLAPTGRLVTPRGDEYTRPPLVLWSHCASFASAAAAVDECRKGWQVRRQAQSANIRHYALFGDVIMWIAHRGRSLLSTIALLCLSPMTLCVIFDMLVWLP